jgi:hypothetical protein
MTLSDAPSLDATHLVCDVHKAEDGLRRAAANGVQRRGLHLDRQDARAVIA